MSIDPTVFGFEELQILDIMRDRMKPGIQVYELTKKTYMDMNVKDAEDLQRCLTHKYNEMMISIWTTAQR